MINVIEGWNDYIIYERLLYNNNIHDNYYYGPNYTINKNNNYIVFNKFLKKIPNIIYSENNDWITTYNNPFTISYSIFFDNLIDKINENINTSIIKVPYDISPNDINILSKNNRLIIHEYIYDLFTIFNESLNNKRIILLYIHRYNSYVVSAMYSNNSCKIYDIKNINYGYIHMINKILDYINNKLPIDDQITELSTQIFNDCIQLNHKMEINIDIETDNDIYEISIGKNELHLFDSLISYIDKFNVDYIYTNENIITEINNNVKIIYKEILEQINYINNHNKIIINNFIIENIKTPKPYIINNYSTDKILLNNNNIYVNIINTIYNYISEENFNNYNLLNTNIYNTYIKDNNYLQLCNQFKNISNNISEEDFNIAKYFNINNLLITKHSYVDNKKLYINNIEYYTDTIPLSYYNAENIIAIVPLLFTSIYPSIYYKYCIYEYIIDIISHYFNDKLEITSLLPICLIYYHSSYIYSVNAYIMPINNYKENIIIINNFTYMKTNDIDKYIEQKYLNNLNMDIYINIPYNNMLQINRNFNIVNKMLDKIVNQKINNGYLYTTIYGLSDNNNKNKNYIITERLNKNEIIKAINDIYY